MSSLVSFDRNGPFGPAMSLMYNSQYFNPNGVSELANLLKKNFMKLTNLKPKGVKDFCNLVVERNQSQSPITPAEIVGTKFFQNMQKNNSSPVNHEKVLNVIVPRMLKMVQESIPHAKCENDQTPQINEWIAKFVENYLTEEAIAKHCELRNAASEKIMEERKNIGMALYKAAEANEFTENDLDTLLDVCKIALNQLPNADHFVSTLNFTGKYLTLFSMNEEDPLALSEDVLSSLSTTLRAKLSKQVQDEIYSQLNLK